MEMNEQELGYQGGKPTWFVVFIILAIAAMVIGYGSTYFFPDLSNWLVEGADPDKIIWMTEKGN